MQVFYVPRAARKVQQKAGWLLFKPFRNATALCSTQGPRNPTEIRVLYVATLQKCICLLSRAEGQKPCRNLGTLCSARAKNQTEMQEIMLRPFRNPVALYSRENPGNPKEMQVNYVETLQKCNCFMFSAGAQKSYKNQGAL